MQNKNELQKKRSYQKPAVIYAKKIEVIASVCDSARAPYGSDCKTTIEPCVRLYSA